VIRLRSGELCWIAQRNLLRRETKCTINLNHPEPRAPQNSDLELINAACHIALIAIELERSHRALKNALVEIKNSENKLRTIIDTIPALAWSARPDGSAEFFNRRWLDYSGLSAEEAADWGWTVALHPEDRDRLTDYWRHLLASSPAVRAWRRIPSSSWPRTAGTLPPNSSNPSPVNDRLIPNLRDHFDYVDLVTSFRSSPYKTGFQDRYGLFNAVHAAKESM
jgi:PAS domain S-box-containing protein